jgi:hypothetical protein
MGIYTVSYSLDSTIYNVQVLTESAESAESIIKREHATATVIAVRKIT